MLLTKVTPIFIVIAANFCSVENVTVCSNFNDYYTAAINPNCHNNPDGESTPAEIVRRWGYNFTEYKLTTEDGYILSLYRLSKKITKPYPVVIGHGIAMNSIAFLTRGNKSLAHVLGENGYDVWLANFRGTRFSKGHVNLTVTDPQYWKMGFHEMGIYDLKSIMNLVYKTTSVRSIYIGYSMGTTIGYVYNIMEQKSAERTLLKAISMAPIAYLEHATSILVRLAPLWSFLKPFLQPIWHGEILPRGSNAGRVCLPFPIQKDICELSLDSITGVDFQEVDPLTYPVTVLQNADSISSGTLDQYSQIVLSHKFQQYDFGTIENLIHYGQPKPPVYNLTKLSVPVTLYGAASDPLSSVQDVLTLFEQLPIKCGLIQVKYKNFVHRDFVVAKDVVSLVYNEILKTLSRFEQGLCG